MWKKLSLITAFLAMAFVPAFCQDETFDSWNQYLEDEDALSQQDPDYPGEDLGNQEYICIQCQVCGAIYELTIDEAKNIDLDSLYPSCHSGQIIDFEEVPCSWVKGEDSTLNSENPITGQTVEVEPVENGTENVESQNTISVINGTEQNDETDYLIENLSSDDPLIRKDAAFSLGDIGDPKAVDPLIGALKDDDADVRSEAANALRKIKDPKAVEPLIQTLKDADPYVRYEAVAALGEINDTKAVDPLIEALKDEDPAIRDKAVAALGEIGDERCVDPLILTLEDNDSDVRESAIWYLGYMKASIAVDPIIQSLNDTEAIVREQAAETLGELGDTSAVEPLKKVLNEDEDSDVQEAARNALNELGWQEEAE